MMTQQSDNGPDGGGAKAAAPEVRVVDLSDPQARANIDAYPQPPSSDLERKLFDGDTICEYVLSQVDDLDQRHARIIGACSWQDLRETPASQLPTPDSELYNVWEVVRAADRPLYLSSRHLGMTYQAVGGREVLTNAISLRALALNGFILACGTKAPPPPACPTFGPINGSGTAWSAYRTTAKAAENAAKALVPGRVTTDSGLEKNGFTCPNPNCRKKTVIGLTSSIDDSGASLSLIASFFYLQWRYSGYAEYSWSASVKCSS